MIWSQLPKGGIEKPADTVAFQSIFENYMESKSSGLSVYFYYCLELQPTGCLEKIRKIVGFQIRLSNRFQVKNLHWSRKQRITYFPFEAQYQGTKSQQQIQDPGSFQESIGVHNTVFFGWTPKWILSCSLALLCNKIHDTRMTRVQQGQ